MAGGFFTAKPPGKPKNPPYTLGKDGASSGYSGTWAPSRTTLGFYSEAPCLVNRDLSLRLFYSQSCLVLNFISPPILTFSFMALKLESHPTPGFCLIHKIEALWLVRAQDCKGAFVHEILQARILEWVAIPFSRGSFQPRNRTWISCITGRFFTN